MDAMTVGLSIMFLVYSKKGTQMFSLELDDDGKKCLEWANMGDKCKYIPTLTEVLSFAIYHSENIGGMTIDDWIEGVEDHPEDWRHD